MEKIPVISANCSVRNIDGLAAIFLRSIAFITLYGAGAIYMKLSPDIQPVLQNVQKRLGIRK